MSKHINVLQAEVQKDISKVIKAKMYFSFQALGGSKSCNFYPNLTKLPEYQCIYTFKK